jgi:DNA-directed RNA polymerase subunit H (RpoH/RPB5)
VLEHKSVPEHRLLTPEEASKVLAGFHITRDQLPKIRKTDPVIRVLERIHGEIAEGSIVRVYRLTQTAGVSEAYRLVVGR